MFLVLHGTAKPVFLALQSPSRAGDSATEVPRRPPRRFRRMGEARAAA
jgi:hypothetical protein